MLFLIFSMLKKKTYPTYLSKYNSNHEKRVIILMISNRKIMALYCSKKIISIIKNIITSLLVTLIITSKNSGDFNCLNCLHSFRTKNKFELHKRV